MASNHDLSIAVVIGGCGYLGSNLVNALRAEPTCSAVHVISRNPTQNLYPDVSYHAGDITNSEQISALFAEIKPRVIFHTASPKHVEPENVHRRTNLTGTRILLSAAAESSSVRAFVYTSTDSAIEQAPGVKLNEDTAKLYTEQSPVNPYAKTKAIADSEVQAANAPPVLSTAVVRIPGLYGENDDNCVGALLNAVKKDQHKIQIGPNERHFEFVYVEKACEAHILAAKALLAQDAKAGGEAFFISDEVSMPYFDFARKFYAGAGHPVAKDEIKVMPLWLVVSFALLGEWLYWIFTLNTKVPEVRSQAIKFLGGGCQWDITKAKNILGYKPVADQDAVIKKVAVSEAKRLGIQ